jgi:2-polyprenyl-3-methyl-5-hydroxy-6-metoxy-1,4-benzoquinol methylase
VKSVALASVEWSIPMTTDDAPTNIMREAVSYGAFYEQLGNLYPETELVHTDKQPGSRYWTVLNELRPFAAAGMKLIDIGCNDGVYTIPYCQTGGKATGVDISDSLVRKCNAKAKMLGLQCSFVNADIDSLDFRKHVQETFEVALFSEVLEHVRNPAAALLSIRSLLEDGAYLVLTTPTPLFNRMDSKWKYPLTLLGGRKLVEPNTVDTREIPALLKYGIASSKYRHDGYYPRALRSYVEGFRFSLIRSYTIGYPERVRQALFLTRALGGDPEMTIRRLPFLNLLGITNVALFRAV